MLPHLFCSEAGESTKGHASQPKDKQQAKGRKKGIRMKEDNILNWRQPHASQMVAASSSPSEEKIKTLERSENACLSDAKIENIKHSGSKETSTVTEQDICMESLAQNLPDHETLTIAQKSPVITQEGIGLKPAADFYVPPHLRKVPKN